MPTIADVELGAKGVEAHDRRLPSTWEGLHYQVAIKNGGTKVLLDDISGVANASEMFYVMGPSGSGKSTFLDALADRLSGSMRGRVLVDGKQLDPSTFKKVVKYVTQEDILTAVLTVEETLVYAASFYTTDTDVQKRRAEEAMVTLGLVKQRTTPVGNALLRGLSGGQRRRLSVGNELVAAPGILLLDELTSGLDSTAASSIMTSMQKVGPRRWVADDRC